MTSRTPRDFDTLSWQVLTEAIRVFCGREEPVSYEELEAFLVDQLQDDFQLFLSQDLGREVNISVDKVRDAPPFKLLCLLLCNVVNTRISENS